MGCQRRLTNFGRGGMTVSGRSCGEEEKGGRGDAGRGDAEKGRRGEGETRGRGMRGRGHAGTRRNGDTEKGDAGTRRTKWANGKAENRSNGDAE